MKLKHIISLLAFIAILVPLSSRAGTLPAFSDGNNEHWYYVVFTSGEAVLEDEGSGKDVMTHGIIRGKESQLWKFSGTPEAFTMTSKSGNHIRIGEYVATTDNPSSAAELRLADASAPGYEESYEIEYPGKKDDYRYFNQWGGAGNGRRIGCYTAGDPSNALTFLAEEDLKETPVLTRLPEFKVSGVTSFTPARRHTLWYDAPAGTGNNDWMEYGLPIGNGEFGAVTFGAIAQDRVQFNDKSLWTGSSKIRGCYQNFGDLYIEDASETFGNTADNAVSDYVRYLDLSQGISVASYTSPDGKTSYNREYLSSYPDKVVAIRLSSSGKGKISIRLRLFNGIRKGICIPEYNDGEISFEGKLDLVSFKAKVRAVATGGIVITESDHIFVKEADEVLIILAGATNFDQHAPGYLSGVETMKAEVDNRVSHAADKGWDRIMEDHVADFSQYYDRVDFRLGRSRYDRPTDQLVKNYNTLEMFKDTDATYMLEELYYAYGRYLLISSSRGMDSPANLQGIWNHTDSPAWQCDIHSNINVQMNYWPAESTNLSEMHMPYLNYIHSMATEHDEWKEYARRSGQSKGWTCFTQNNIFGHSDFAENYVIANAWYCSHLWQHYKYTLDKDFLREKALPVMLDCTDFWMERLIMDADGKWVAPNEWSPEHGPGAEDGTAHAQQILDELFSSVIEAIGELGESAGVSEEYLAELKEKHAGLDLGLATETYDGAWGNSVNGIKTGDTLLREWKTSGFSAGENGHRHQSHLMALYPFSAISPESEWHEAAKNSLQMRGDVSTGWSLAWRIALWARALDGEHAHKIIKSALRHSTSYGQSGNSGGIYYNLFDSHAPFQIDGNFGYTAAVTEMLVQTYGEKIRLLPALPQVWSEGSLSGIKGEGNFEIGCSWHDGKLTVADIKSISGRKCRIYYPSIATATVTDSHGNTIDITKVDADNIEFDTTAGASYVITTEYGLGVEVPSDKPCMLMMDGKRIYSSDITAKIKVFDITGALLATGTGSVSLSDYSDSIVVATAETSTGRLITQKFAIAR